MSLWLRTAQRGRKLTSLNNNIKCGNSLIDDPEVAGDKAFSWEKEFPEVFEKGGFDVVIGNPPYVRQELLGMITKRNYIKKFQNVGNGTADLYIYFYELGLSILKKEGLLSYITPNKWFKTKYGKELRDYLIQFQVISIIDFFENRVFHDASTEPQIILIKKNISNSTFSYLAVQSKFDYFDNTLAIQIAKEDLYSNEWVFLDGNEKKLLKKLYNNSVSLMDHTSKGLKRGILTGLNKAFIINKNVRNKIIKNDPTCDQIIEPYANATDIKAWHLENREEYFFINTGYDIEISENSYKGVWQYLNGFYDDLVKRQDKGKTPYNLRACDYYDLFKLPKIIFIHTAVKHHFYFDYEGIFINNNSYLIANSDYVICGILNSKIFYYLKIQLFPAFGNAGNKGRSRLNFEKMARIPIPSEITDHEHKNFEEVIKKQQLNSKNLNVIEQTFLSLIKSKYKINSVTKSIKKWYDLNFSIFLKELQKARKKSAKENKIEYVKLTLSEEAEWMQYFNEQKEKALAIKAEIDKTDKEIDVMVYELYGLTAEEIAIVEESK